MSDFFILKLYCRCWLNKVSQSSISTLEQIFT